LHWKKSGATLNGSVELHITYDEEAGGEIGPRYILDQGLSRPDLAIGAGFSYTVVSAHNAACTSKSRCWAARLTPPAPSPELTRWKPRMRS
jgi:hypothetical protein